MRRDGGLADAALEVLHSDDLQRVAFRPPGPRTEHGPHLVDLGERVTDPAARGGPLHRRQAAILLCLADGGAGAPDEVGRPGDREAWRLPALRTALLTAGAQRPEDIERA